jgi:hypothetical protein
MHRTTYVLVTWNLAPGVISFPGRRHELRGSVWRVHCQGSVISGCFALHRRGHGFLYSSNLGNVCPVKVSATIV